MRKVSTTLVSSDIDIKKLHFEEKPEYREVSQSERLNLCEEYVFLDEDLIFYSEQRESLRQRYRELDKELAGRIKRCQSAKERLRDAVRYCLITVESRDAERASRPTSMLSQPPNLAAVEVRN